MAVPAARPMYVLFDLGFRPFFLLAALYAIVCVATLVGALSVGIWPNDSVLSPSAWHGHEMLYGFAAAAIAGFLLTAVPNWTGTRPISPVLLMMLVLIWLGGRVALVPYLNVAGELASFMDLAFLPVLAAVLAKPLIRARNYRNFGFVILLALLVAGNVLFHNLRQKWFEVASIDGLRIAVNTVLLLVVVVGGRIVPAFTRNALVRRGIAHTIAPTPALDAFAIGAVVLVGVCDATGVNSALAASVAATAALLLLIRLTRWQGWKLTDEPIVWVLHIAYVWIVVALALKAMWFWFAAPIAAHWMHALTAGAFGTMILGVMSRVALGHTGRPLVVSRSIAAAYAMVSLGAALRVFAGVLLPTQYMSCVAIGGVLWAAAFAVFVVVYLPISTRPRIDAPAAD